VITLNRSRLANIDKTADLMGAHYLHAYLECDAAIQAVIREMVEVIDDPDTDDDDCQMALSTLHEALFPARSPHDGNLGTDLEDDERHATGEEAATQAEMDREEATFASRVAALLRERGLTQEQLAEALGVGQPAVSMMLNRKARPQRRTVEKVAHALGVFPEQLWPGQGAVTDK
jgi:predicted XRE-type DNA-binding protein